MGGQPIQLEPPSNGLKEDGNCSSFIHDISTDNGLDFCDSLLNAVPATTCTSHGLIGWDIEDLLLSACTEDFKIC